MPGLKKNPNKNDSPKRFTRSAEQLAKDFAAQGKVAESRKNKGDDAGKSKDAAAGKDAGVRKNKRQSSSKDDQVRNILLLILL